MEDKLTREKALALHKILWRTINKLVIAAETCDDIRDIKIKALMRLGFDKVKPYIQNYCFCCEYNKDMESNDNCSKCPVDWQIGYDLPSYMCLEKDSSYRKFFDSIEKITITDWLENSQPELNFIDIQKLADLAMEIAELPEKAALAAKEEFVNESIGNWDFPEWGRACF